MCAWRAVGPTHADQWADGMTGRACRGRDHKLRAYVHASTRAKGQIAFAFIDDEDEDCVKVVYKHPKVQLTESK